MACWLLKTEPSQYSFADLLREKRTTWSGVSNAAALQNIRAMAKGDQVLIYHTGDQRAVVGTGSIFKGPYTAQPNTKLAVVDVAAGKALKRPVTLAQIKADRRFADWALLKIGRLSVVPTTPEQFAAILELGSGSRSAEIP
jgi:predicted RNA-binding protein with PUA-like domain